MTASNRPKIVRKGDRIATVIFRILVGGFGLLILGVAIYFKLYAQSVHAFLTFGAFCGLLLGYAFGGDKWGARLFGFFSGHRVQVDDQRKTSKSDDANVI